MNAGRWAFGWFLTLALAIPGSLASSQVFTAPDVPTMAEMAVAGANPIDPELVPYWQLVHNQQEIFADVFHHPWTKYDTYLPLAGWAHGDYTDTTGVTRSGEEFGIDVVLAVTADLEHDEGIDEEVRDQLLAMQFEWSWVAAYLSGPQGTVPIVGILMSMVANGEQSHHLLITQRLEASAMADLEAQQDYYYGRSLPSILCADANGEPVTTDPLYDTCMLSVQAGYARERECLRGQVIVGQIIGIGFTAGCWAINLTGGGIASPVCFAVTGAWLGYSLCMAAKNHDLWAALQYAQSCCCTSLQCRFTTPSGCADITTCDIPYIICDDVACAPFF
ncbi:MAG: hypothetical protein KJZ65_09385 [Phycisphaerales bacterium]|nr:hypothetical protein [Phycisphaerales bacterium]